MQLTRDSLRSWWYEIEQSLWFLPALLTGAAIALALVSVRIDQHVRFDREFESIWVFGGGAEGARGVLSAIAGTMMSVTALVFSITVVALQLASSQLTPRVLRSVMADRGNQAVLGVFVATFTYALIVLRAVRSPLEDRGGFVPALSVSIAIVLTLLSIALLIFFMHHSANSLRTSVVIARISDGTRGLIEELYPEEIGRPAPEPPPFPGVPYVIHAKGSGYLQSIEADALFDLAEERSLTIAARPLIGEFVLPGAEIAMVWLDGALDDETAGQIRGALTLGFERTMQSDVAFGLQQLADIALRALSPGINDPTTAMTCVHHLAALIVQLANRGQPDEARTDKDGSVRLLLKGPPFEHLVAVAFAQIRHFGADDPVFTRDLTAVIEHAATLVPLDHRPPLLTIAGRAASASEAPDDGVCGETARSPRA